jgi:AcrR family transcriptional regulator
MSINAPRRPVDRRVQRTREALGSALMAILLEKPYTKITVQEVLDRAGIARATLYLHYRDKDDLLLSHLDDFFGRIVNPLSRWGARPGRLLPVSELFGHVAEEQPLLRALASTGKMSEIFDLLRAHLARAIESRLARQTGSAVAAPRGATAQALAGALVALLTWWLGRGMPEPPERLDEVFHDLAVRGAGVERWPAEPS